MRRLLIVLVAALVAAMLGAVPVQADPVRVVVYGDSLTTEAQPYLHGLVREVSGVATLVRGAPGGATCDLFAEMARDARHLRPAFVVLQFSGNNLTDCMEDRRGNALTGDAWLAKYRADTVRAIQLVRPMGAPIYLATSPIGLLAERRGEDDVHRLARMHREVAARHAGVRLVDAGRSVLALGRYWTANLKCLPREPCSGGVDNNLDRVNRVRAHDGVHFCPTPYAVVSECPVWSAGAHRFALGLVLVPLRRAGMVDQRRLDRSTGAGFTP